MSLSFSQLLIETLLVCLLTPGFLLPTICHSWSQEPSVISKHKFIVTDGKVTKRTFSSIMLSLHRQIMIIHVESWGCKKANYAKQEKKFLSISHMTLRNGSFTLLIQHTFVGHMSYMRLRTRATNSCETQALFSRSYIVKSKAQVISIFVWYRAPLWLSTFQSA